MRLATIPITEKDKKPAGKKPLAILAVILGLVVALCAVFGIVYKSQGEDGKFANAINSIFNKQEEQTTETSTTEKPTVKPDESELDDEDEEPSFSIERSNVSV